MDVTQAKQLISSVKGKSLSRSVRGDLAIELAGNLLQLSQLNATKEEKRALKKVASIMKDAKGRELVTLIADRFFRSQNPYRSADEIIYLFKTYGIPKYIPWVDKVKFLIFRYLGKILAPWLVPVFRKQIHSEFSAVILPENKEILSDYFKRCKEQGIEINVNRLGEAILGEEEAKKRMEHYMDDLLSPEIGYISIKDSTLYSQINLVGWDQTLQILAERLRKLYRQGGSHFYLKPNGNMHSKLVNLDMEEYKDLDLTLSLFQKVLDEEEFLKISAGVVLQSYLPNSYDSLQKLTKWAIHRVERGGSPIRIRIVKGANREMERVESNLKGWDCPTFSEKIDSDANFKRMLEFSLIKDHTKGVQIGIGSHNLFDISYALLLRSEQGTENEVSFEMLAGMAPSLMRIVNEVAEGMLLYSPTVQSEAYYTAIAYLIRRLDENSGKGNFLNSLFDLQVNSLPWKDLKNQFLKSLDSISNLSIDKRRKQNRTLTPIQPPQQSPFVNEPDTDFSLEENRKWAKEIFIGWENRNVQVIPLVINGETKEGPLINNFDPSRSDFLSHRFSQATTRDIDTALEAAKKEQSSWSSSSMEERSRLLWNVAQKLREHRAILLGAMLSNGAKPIHEGDSEVSEAIDFCEYYRRSYEKMCRFQDIEWKAKGTLLVAPPWNFPCSIPTGGIAGALMAGNCVIFKPAPQAILVGWHLATAFWEAGVSRKVLQFITCNDEPEGSYLIKHPLLSGVILTGGTATAHHFISLRPNLDLIAETGGKNAIIVSAMSDRDLAIRDSIQSAFSYSGQKCSACSLLILEKELYDNQQFLNQLKDAALSLNVGSVWNPINKVPPLILPPEGKLLRALTTLEEGESWLLKPQASKDNPHIWSPGIKLGVREGSYTHQTEFFGPILGVMRAENLVHALRLANGTPYGLTAGLHSLDEREQALWKNEMVAGNLYINRGITGAIIRRQPFGGCKASSFGPGAKAGGPNYVYYLTKPQQKFIANDNHPFPDSLKSILSIFPLDEDEKNLLILASASYAYWAEVLKEPYDPTSLLGQDNFFYHVPRRTLIRFNQGDNTIDLLKSISAAWAAGNPLVLSSDQPLHQKLEELDRLSFLLENKEKFLERLESGSPPYVRLLSPPSKEQLLSASKGKVILFSSPVLSNGRFELLNYLREVSLSIEKHRYGHIYSAL